MRDRMIKGYRLVMTCGACPEQYDVFLGDRQIGYLRLRHGCFTVEVPDCGGRLVYEAEPNGDGIFEEGEREPYLRAAIEAIEAAAEVSGRSRRDEMEKIDVASDPDGSRQSGVQPQQPVAMLSREDAEELVRAVNAEIAFARTLTDENFGAVNWGDLGAVDVECRVSLLSPSAPTIVVTVEEADPTCRLAEWLNERLGGRFPGLWIVCEW